MANEVYGLSSIVFGGEIHGKELADVGSYDGVSRVLGLVVDWVEGLLSVKRFITADEDGTLTNQNSKLRIVTSIKNLQMIIITVILSNLLFK